VESGSGPSRRGAGPPTPCDDTAGLDRFALLAESVQYAAHTAYEQVTGEEDELFCEVDRLWETLEDDLGAAPLPQPVRLPRLETLFAQNHAILLDRFGERDAAGATVVGRAGCAVAWRGFFAAFPDYHNRFDAVSTVGSIVTVDGRSECSEPALAGPARWSAVVRFDKVARWQVEAVPDQDPTHRK
jgi:hypothetical protein